MGFSQTDESQQQVNQNFELECKLHLFCCRIMYIYVIYYEHVSKYQNQDGNGMCRRRLRRFLRLGLLPRIEPLQLPSPCLDWNIKPDFLNIFLGVGTSWGQSPYSCSSPCPDWKIQSDFFFEIGLFTGTESLLLPLPSLYWKIQYLRNFVFVSVWYF